MAAKSVAVLAARWVANLVVLKAVPTAVRWAAAMVVLTADQKAESSAAH